jgi:hypothetical protein
MVYNNKGMYMARYDISSNGAQALMQLARDLLSAYGNVISAGEVLEEKIVPLEEKDAELYSKIIEASYNVTSRVKKDKDEFTQLAKNLMSLSVRIQEIIGDISSVTVASSYGGVNNEINTTFVESADENSLLESFNNGLYDTKTIRLVDPPEGQYQAWIDSRDIVGVFHNDSVNKDDFWTHHGETKERFAELASKVETVKNLMDQGIGLEHIKQNPDLTACVEQYFSSNRAVRVYQYGDKYIFGGDGRHRVRIAQEMGINIPVLIYKVAQKI